MSNSVSLNSAIAAISEACFALCPVQKREALLTLEQFQTFDGYVEALVAIIDVNSRGSTIMIDCRHLAAVLLKNLIGKRSPQSANVRQNSPVSADCRPLLTPERTALKAFLAEYLHEPECKVALQLSLVTAKIARQDGDMWLKEWPGLIPSLLNAIQGNSFQATGADTYSPASAINQESELAVHTHLRAIRGLSCLSELLSELSNKASGCASSLFAKNYAMLCLQLYPVISKQWAENMKKLLPALSGMCAKADASHTTSAAYKLDGVTSLSASELESLIVHNVLLSKVLRVVLEFGFELICAKVTMFFKTFFKCYLNAIKSLADFVRRHRPLCANIRRVRAQTNTIICMCVCNKVSALPVLMKMQLMGDDDADDQCDAYMPIDIKGGADEAALLSIINLSMKLLKSLVCAPVVLQKKHPMLLLPAMNCLLDYYYNLLVEEYTYPAQPSEMSYPAGTGSDAMVCSVSNTAGQCCANISGTTQLSEEQRAWLYLQEEVREALPLNYLMKATALFLANVLSCSAYDEYNIYQQPPCALGGGSSDSNTGSMEESGELKPAVAGACDLRKTFFSAERVTLLVRMLLYPMLSYTGRELAEWSENPEEFVVAQLSANETCSVKNAAQSLFCGIMELSPGVVCDILARFLMDCGRQETILNPAALSSSVAAAGGSNIANIVSPGVVQWAVSRELKIWDAVYTCAGLGVAQLTPYFSKLKDQCEASGQAEACRAECPSSFTDNVTPTLLARQEGASYWVQHYLGPMVQELLKCPIAGSLPPQGQQLLRARLIWLLSVWMHKFDASVLQHVLTILIDIVGPTSDSDIVVKMYAIQALGALINLEIFDISALKFQVASAMEALCLLARSLQEAECKVTVLELAGELIRLLSVQMSALKPLITPLAEYLQNLWRETGEADPSRCTILEVMALLVKAAKGHSVSILPITTPLIAAACRCGSLSSRNSNNSINSSGSGRRDSTRAGGGTPSSCNNGFLAKDGLALWLAVMQNITESQYATYHVELQNLVCGAMAGLNISPSRAEAAPSGAQSVTQRWNIFAEADSAELITSLMQVVEAYALLGGEAHCILLDAQCRAALTSLYCGALGKVEAKLVQFVVRPLQALLMCCPILAGQYFSGSGLLGPIMRILNASVSCPHLQKLMEAHKEADTAIVSYLNFVALLFLLNPSALFSALTVLKVEILTHIQSTTNQPVSDQLLTETILLAEIVSLMFRLVDSLKYGPAPQFKTKMWALALLSLFPPTLLNNAVFVPPNAAPTSNAHSKPTCIIGRTMLMIMETVQFTLGRAKLEQHLRDNCPTYQQQQQQQRMDFRSVCFWFPSNVTAQQLYYWTEPILQICKGVLKEERSKKGRARMLRQLSALLGGGSSEGSLDPMTDCYDNDDSDSSDSSSDCDCSDDEGPDAQMSMKSSGSDLDAEEGIEMGTFITAQTGDSLSLDVPEVPLLIVHRSRLRQSGLLSASVEAHLKEKLSQLCRTLGEEQFSTLHCIAELQL